MRKFLISFLLAVLIAAPTEVFAAEYETPHEFSAGDTISADMMNEIFTLIKNTVAGFKNNSDLLGSWSCTQYSTSCIDSLSSSHASESRPSQYWTDHSSGLYATRSAVVTFSGTNSFKFNSRGLMCVNYKVVKYLNILYPNWAIEGTYEIAGNILYSLRSNKPVGSGNEQSGNILANVNLVADTASTRAEIQKFSESQFLWKYDDQHHLVCDKQNLPPSTPATFTASASGKTVSLAWTDSITDETGFKVLRKDSLTGSFSTVTTTSADATSYSDTVTDAGSYWYRVSATNSNGDSTGSKVVKVDVE